MPRRLLIDERKFLPCGRTSSAPSTLSYRSSDLPAKLGKQRCALELPIGIVDRFDQFAKA